MKHTIKKIVRAAAVSLTLPFCLLLPGTTASAASVGDVIAHAYQVGMPEELIQQYIAMGSGREWTSAQCDQAIAALDSWYGQRDNAISGGGSAAPPEPMKPEEFEELELEEKKEYLNDLPAEDKQEYLDVMTNDEKNQLLKELEPAQQVEVISGMLGFGAAFGYSFAIEDFSDGSVMISARDENEKLVGVTVLGDSIEKTGITYTEPILIASALMLFSACGMIFAVRKCRDEK